MELDLTASAAAEAAITAYRAARCARAGRQIADDVALARYRAYFPLATTMECRIRMHAHLAHERTLRQRTVTRPAFALELAGSN